MSLVKKYPLAVFVCLAYAFSWWLWPLYVTGLSPSPVIGFGPFLAAVVVLGITVGRAAVIDLLKRMLPARIGWQWYALALLLPIVLSGIAVYLTVALGAPMPSVERLGAWPGVVPTFFLLLLVPGIGGAWEEPGWRGYALPKLEPGRSRLVASLLLWVIIVVWHLPLFVYDKIPLADVAMMVGAVIVFNWLYYAANRNIFVIMVSHAMNNAVSGEFFSPMFSGAAADQLGWMRALAWGVVALAVILLARPSWLARAPHSVSTPYPDSSMIKHGG
jgi:uncharacterized protein